MRTIVMSILALAVYSVNVIAAPAMRLRSFMCWPLFLFAMENPCRVVAAEPPATPTLPALNEARKTGWELAMIVVEKLEAGDNNKWPGIAAWLKEFRNATKRIDLKTSPEKWPRLDVDSLMTRNPKFWDAYYEIAPGDPGAVLLQAGLLLAGGECDRAAYAIVIGSQRNGIPKAIWTGFDIILSQADTVKKKANVRVYEGIKLHDAGEYDAALKKYTQAIQEWPANGFAHYERGLTLRETDRAKTPKGNKETFSKEVVEAFALARRHDPWQWKAYQGSDPEVTAGLVALGKKG